MFIIVMFLLGNYLIINLFLAILLENFAAEDDEVEEQNMADLDSDVQRAKADIQKNFQEAVVNHKSPHLHDRRGPHHFGKDSIHAGNRQDLDPVHIVKKTKYVEWTIFKHFPCLIPHTFPYVIHFESPQQPTGTPGTAS